MQFKDYYDRVNWRDVCIGIGWLSTVLWIIQACHLTISRSPIDSSVVGRTLEDAVCFSAFIFCSTSAAASVFMVFGIKKGLINYTFAWLAIHFVIILFAIPLYMNVILLNIWPRADGVLDNLQGILLTIAATLSWAIVFQYVETQFIKATQVQPASTDKDKILEMPDEPIKQSPFTRSLDQLHQQVQLQVEPQVQPQVHLPAMDKVKSLETPDH